MVPYVTILVRGEGATWRAYLPDFIGCRAEGDSAEAALERAKDRAWKLRNGVEMPTPRSLIEIWGDSTWKQDRNIDWQDAIVVMVAL